MNSRNDAPLVFYVLNTVDTVPDLASFGKLSFHYLV